MQVAENKDSVRIITYDDNSAVSVHTKDTEKTALVTISSETDSITGFTLIRQVSPDPV